MVSSEKIIQKLGKRKIKVFSLFLLCSLLAWSVSNLSESYEAPMVFDIVFENLPDSLLVKKDTERKLKAQVMTSGFRMLYNNIWPKKIAIDVSNAEEFSERYYLPKDILKREFEADVSGAVRLVEFENDTLFLGLYQVASKEVPIRLDVDLQLAKNHLLEEKIAVTPSTVLIKGPKNEIAKVNEVKTVRFQRSEVTTGFSESINLVKPEVMQNAELSLTTVEISAKVAQFSEKIFEIGVDVLNIPEGFRVTTLPAKVQVLCKAPVERLKTLKDINFKIVGDYKVAENTNILEIRLHKKPSDTYEVKLMKSEVRFILEEL